MKYSVAIRTLGTSGEFLKRELISLHNQTIKPQEIIIYIARGYQRPSFVIGIERYVEVDKGMVSQRALEYTEITAENILLLDDDVELASDSAEILLKQLENNEADCVAADTFANHKMSVYSKIKTAVGALVFPRFNQRWAFKLHSNGSFSYINNVKKDCYPSQSAAGPCALWRKKTLLALRFEDEKWLDKLGFAYGDDDLEFYKLYVNGGLLLVSFNAGVKHLNAKSTSSLFQQNRKKFYIRAKSNYLRWHRMQFQSRKNISKFGAVVSFCMKISWLFILHIGVSIITFDIVPLLFFCQGIKEGVHFSRSIQYNKIPAYKNENIILR